MAQMNEQTIDEIFTYHQPKEGDPQKYTAIREAARDLAWVILTQCPPCADRTVALRKVREAVMDANASIALNGLI